MNYFDILLAKKLEDDRDPRVEGLSVTENGRYHEDGVVYDPVIVALPLDSKSITSNGTYKASDDNLEGYNEVDVDVPLPENAYLLKDIPNTPTAIATFNDGANLPMPKLEVAIEPVQEGSGDPSPENIRPISGWSAVDVNVSGVNVWDEEWEVGGLVSGCLNSKNFIPVIPNTTYFFAVLSDKYPDIYWYDENKMLISFTPSVYNHTFDTPSNCHFIKFRMANAYGTTYNNDISINYPSTDTDYHAYNGHTYTIDLDGTRYGGKLDVVSGVLTVDRVGVDLGDLNWTYGNGFFRTTDLNATIKKAASNFTKANVISSIYTVETWNAITNTDNGKLALSAGTADPLLICNTDYTDATAFKQAMNGVQLVYELATPIEIQLTSTAIKSLQGINNVFADTGDILDGQYFSKEE